MLWYIFFLEVSSMVFANGWFQRWELVVVLGGPFKRPFLFANSLVNKSMNKSKALF